MAKANKNKYDATTIQVLEGIAAVQASRNVYRLDEHCRAPSPGVRSR